MKSRFILLFFLLLYNIYSQAQAPNIEIWDRRFGGTKSDMPSSFQQTSDGGFVLGGYSNSGVSGDKTQPNWDTTINETGDYWIVKIDSLGNKHWDKRFGGTSSDGLAVIQQTTDDGYILGGGSYSGANGDKTQPSWGYQDYWLVKIDSLGNKQWDRDYGGFNLEIFSALQQTNDGGYIMGGYSNSDIGGDKTQDDWDTTYETNDYWIVKVASNGNKQWDKGFGGTGEDELVSLVQTLDGGYILGGISNSGISGDKTQANWDSSLMSYDFWIVKIDSSGIKQWDKRFGAIYGGNFSSLIQTHDGGYVLAGTTGDSIGGDKTQDACRGGLGGGDYWIVKIDSNGNKLGDWDFGGNADEQAPYISQTTDGGFLISGYSDSPASCDKTENNLGYHQVWIVKTDSLFNKQWDKTILTTGNDNGYAIETKEGCYVALVNTEAGIGGYKTQPNWGVVNQTNDYWIVKFCYTGTPEGIKDLTTKVQLNVYPNPFSNELDITLTQPNLKQADFTICNILGQTIYTQHETNLSPSYTKMLDLSYLPNGVYFVEVVVGGELITKEVVKQ